ncbi:MAG: DUF4279 domain-containing protein [Acidobacteriia bacterium]|nr:DUF4279 domain-containing protein [Terriglobia bacterium]
MEIFRFSIHLRLTHPSADPDDISTALSMAPSRKWKAGEARTTPDGQPLAGIYAHTYWASEAKKGEDSELLAVMESGLDELEKRAPFLSNFVASGGRIEYYISWFASERSGGDAIPWRLLARLAALHINLSLDVYSYQEPGGLPTPAPKAPGATM